MRAPVSRQLWALLLALSVAQLAPLSPAMAASTSGAEATPSDYIAQGARSFSRGDFQQALVAWDRALAHIDGAREPAARSRVLLHKTAAYAALGMSAQATEAAREALALAERAGDRPLAAEAKAAFGNAYLLDGHVDEARTTLQAAIEAADALGRPAIAGAARNDLGNLLATQRAFDQARPVYEQALRDASAAHDGTLAAKVALNLARALTESGASDAGTYLQRVLAQVRPLEPSHDKAYALIGLGRLYLRTQPASGDATNQARFAAYGALREAAETALAIDDPRALSYALGYLGELYERAGRDEDALRLTRRALHEAQRVDAPESLYLWQWQAGRLLRARGDTNGAIESYERAVHSLESIRPELSSNYMGARISFRERVGPVFLQLADLLLRQAVATTDPNQRQQYLKAARKTVELLKGAELADYFQDACVAEFKSRTAGVEQIGKNTAAIYPIILPDRTAILLSLPDGIRLYTVPVSADRLTETVHQFRSTLETRITHRYRIPAQQLYDWLIRPLEPELEHYKIDTLVFVPDGPLRTIPLSALYDGENFLIAKYAVATTPGLTLTDPKPIPRGHVEVLAAGLTEAVQGFPALPNVAQEIAEVHKLYGGTVLENQNFVVPKVEQQLEETPYTIVHIASHAQFSSDLKNTFLLTYNGKLHMNGLGQLMSITAFREKPVELLTLSACQTAAGDDRAALGLAGVAVKSGARSALASLWFINDPASAKLVSAFYQDLRDPSVSKAKALQEAQLKLMQDRRYRHPAYWSPFLLIGNWL
jgi:CHAT domain-containing protein